jgi:hypothetical protein
VGRPGHLSDQLSARSSRPPSPCGTPSNVPSRTGERDLGAGRAERPRCLDSASSLSSSFGKLSVRVVVQRAVPDRVEEPRREAALARHYGDQEHLTIAEIARRLGRAEATIKAYLHDPSGSTENLSESYAPAHDRRRAAVLRRITFARSSDVLRPIGPLCALWMFYLGGRALPCGEKRASR